MADLAQQLQDRLKAALALWGAWPGKPTKPDYALLHESIGLLGEVFVVLPLGKLDAFLDNGLTLAGFVRAATNSNADEVVEAGICYSGIHENPVFQRDSGQRLQALIAPSRIFLQYGMMGEHAVCIEAIGDAQKQLERPMEASISYRTALKICERTAGQHVPRLLLKVAQVFRDESLRGRIDWEATQSYFQDCCASLKKAAIEERERNRIRAACLIDGAPCHVEIPRDNLQRGEGSLKDVREGIARSRRDIRQGITFARQDPELQQYVRQGEMNLLRLDQIEDELENN
jgi:hypothetical protein